MGYLTGKHNRFASSVCSKNLQNRIVSNFPITGTETSSLVSLETINLYPKTIWNEIPESLFKDRVE